MSARTNAEPRCACIGKFKARNQPKLDYRTSVRYNGEHAYGKTTGHTGFHSEIPGRAPIPAIGSGNRQTVRDLPGDGSGPFVRTSAERLSAKAAISVPIDFGTGVGAKGRDSRDRQCCGRASPA